MYSRERQLLECEEKGWGPSTGSVGHASGAHVSLARSDCANPENPISGYEKWEELSFIGSHLPSLWPRKTQHNPCTNLARKRHCWPQVSCLQPGIMAPGWFPHCEMSVLAITLSRPKGYLGLKSQSFPLGGLSLLFKHAHKTSNPSADHTTFCIPWEINLSRGDQLVPSPVSTLFLACGVKASSLCHLQAIQPKLGIVV